MGEVDYVRDRDRLGKLPKLSAKPQYRISSQPVSSEVGAAMRGCQTADHSLMVFERVKKPWRMAAGIYPLKKDSL